MTFDLTQAIKRRSAYRTFAADCDGGLGHAYLVYCEDDVVRSVFLTLAAQRIFCKNACGECDVCRAIEEKNYLDVKYFDGADMKVPDVDALTESASVRPVMGDYKVYLINNADKLSPQAQNKLLKTYEEPPKYVVILLGATNENGLLATIKSRAKKIHLEELTPQEVVDYLVSGGADEKSARTAAAISDGKLQLADDFLTDPKISDRYDRCFGLMLDLNNSSQIVDWLYTDLFAKENILSTFDFLEIILSDVLKKTSGSTAPFKNVGRDFDLTEIAKKFSPQSASASLYALNEGRKKLYYNVGALSVAEGVLFDMLEARYKWQ
ncbi:MAG: hypothetical protein IJ735_03475 [Clostridia bacterium]|nr:hypothetical protein [Clostridia bacterium]